jgi:mRNA-degrading endonuclease toxin of MazEF toxin-antitoxin module
LRQGDIIKVPFGPSKGHEPQKSRPAVVLSSDQLNAISSLTVIAPITSVDNRYPLHIRLMTDAVVAGFVCVEQLSALDLSVRKCELLGSVEKGTMSEILEAIGAMFDI